VDDHQPQSTGVASQLHHIKDLLSAPIDALVQDFDEVKQILEEIKPQLLEVLQIKLWPTGHLPFFRRGLNTKLKEHLNLIKANTFSELVNMALTQEDCITAHRAEKKRRISTGPASVQSSQYQIIQDAQPRAPQWNFRLVDWFSNHFNNKKSINLLYLCNNHNQLAHGQMFNKSNREAVPIKVSIAGVRISSSEIVRSARSLIKGRVLVRMTGTRVRSR
jgi:hypothetical protein